MVARKVNRNNSAAGKPAKTGKPTTYRKSSRRTAEDRPVEPRGDRRGPAKSARPDARGEGRSRSAAPTARRGGKGTSVDAVAGRNPVVEALRAGVPAKELLVALKAEMDERMVEAIRLAKRADLPIREVVRAVLTSTTDTEMHQGIALVIKPFQYADFEKIIATAEQPGLIVALDGVTDPHNLGAIVRSAAAFGANGVVIPERRNASMTGSAWKASAGAAARLPIAQVTNLVRAIESAKKAGYFVVGLDAEGDEELGSFSLSQESIFVIVGSEGKGLSRLVREKCDLILQIGMTSDVESLNASVATAVVLHWVANARR